MQKKSSKQLNKDLEKRFANAYEFCDEDTNKFIVINP